MRREILGMRPRHARHRRLGEIVEGREPIVVGIVLGRAVGHLDEEAARTLDQQRQRMMRRDQMRVDAEPQHAQAVLEIVLPDRLVPFEELLAAPDVVDEDVEAALLGADALDQLPDLVGNEMIDPDGDAGAAGCRDQLRRLLDRFRPRIFGLLLARRPSGDVDRRAGGAQFHRDAAAGAARRAGDQGDLSLQRHRALPNFLGCPGRATRGGTVNVLGR